MNIELRFLQKAIEDNNFISFYYENSQIKKVKPLKLTDNNGILSLHTAKKIFLFSQITKLQILKERF